MEPTHLITKFLVFLFTSIIVQSCVDFHSSESDNNPLEDSLPRMRISSLSNYLKLINNSIVLIDKIGIEVRIDCWAPFPINIEFNGHLSNREIHVHLIKRTTNNNSSTSTSCYYVNTTMESYEEITGNYSCFDLQNQNLKASYYIFHSPHPPESLLNRGQLLTVTIKYDDTHNIIIPCPTSIPNVTVHLYNERNEKMNLTLYKAEYDPRIGFIIPKSNDLLGNFQCRTELSVNDKVDIRIIPEERSIFFPSQAIIVLREDDPLNLTCKSIEEIMLDVTITNPGQPGDNTHKIIEIDNNEIDNKISNREYYKYQLHYNSNETTLKSGATGRISCWTKSKSELIHEWTFSVRPKQENQVNGTHKKNVSSMTEFNSHLCASSGGGKNIVIKLYECNNWIECKMRKCKFNDRTCTNYECNNVNTFKCLPNGIIQCFNAQNQSSHELIYFTGLGKSSWYTNWKLAPMHEIFQIQNVQIMETMITSDDNSNELSVITMLNNSSLSSQLVRLRGGLMIEATCEGSSFVVATGFQWFLRMKGSNDEIQVPEDQVKHTWKSLTEKYIIKSIVTTRITTRTTHIVCKGPIWNSTDWVQDVVSVQELMKGSLSSASWRPHIKFSCLLMPIILNYFNS